MTEELQAPTSRGIIPKPGDTIATPHARRGHPGAKSKSRSPQVSLSSLRRDAFHNFLDDLFGAHFILGRSTNSYSKAVALHSHWNLVLS